MTTTRAVIYARISRDAEGDGGGVERQITSCRELADRRGLSVVEVLTDNDVGASERTSAKKIRHGFNELIERAKAGEFTHVLAYSNSRLTRRMSELDILVKLHENYGVEFQTVVSGQDDLSTADGLMVARIKASVDAAESDRISERTRAAHLQNRLKGKPKGSPLRAFGFEKDGVTHNPDEAALIRAAVPKVIAGASIRQIGKQWEAMGVRRVMGKVEWNHKAVKDALFSWKAAGIRAYRGEPVYNADGEMVRGEWEPIIDVADRTKALLELETHYAKPKKREGRGWLLSGLLRCGRCGRTLYGNAGQPPRYRSFYVCSDGRTAHLGITAERLEEYLQEVVFRYILDRAIHGANELQEAVIEDWPNEKRLETLGEKITELMDAYNSDELPHTIVFPQVEKLEAERKELRKERDTFYAAQRPIPRTIESRADALRSYRRSWEKPLEDRQLLLRQEMDSVVILPGVSGSRSAQKFEARVRINWREPHPEYNGMSAEDAARTLLMTMTIPDEPPLESLPFYVKEDEATG